MISPKMLLAAACCLMLLWAPCAQAASAPLSQADLTAGYGRKIGDERRAVALPGRDAQGNLVIVNGLMADPSGLSGGLNGGLDSLGSPFAPATSTTAAAVANVISIVAGSWNTIIVEASQTNTGAVSAWVRGGAGEAHSVAP